MSERNVLLWLPLILTLCLAAGTNAAPAALPPLEISVHDLGLAYGHFDRDVTRLRKIATQFHATSLKFDAGWNVIEGQEGKYEFANTDYLCSVAAAAHLKVKLIANNGWSVPNWLWQHKDQEPFALNSAGQTGRQGQSLDSAIGKYPAPVLLSYSNPWVLGKIRAWQGALVRHLEQKFPGLLNEYICEGEIYLNPDNDTGNLLFDYNPWTIRKFRVWLKTNPASPYCGDPSPDRTIHADGISFDSRWKAEYKQWDQVEPPREFKAGDIPTRDWCAFLQWYVAWSYQQVASGLRAQTHLPITFLFNTFTGVPMPNDHVWGPSRTQDEYWLVFKMAAPYVTALGVTAYPYDPGWEVDASGQWSTSMAFLSTCSRLLHRPIQIVEGGGTTMHPRALADLRWQLFSAYSHDLLAIDLGYFDMPQGSFSTYSWNPALEFPETEALCRYYTSLPRSGPLPSPPIAILYNSSGELLAPGDGTEARCVRAIGRALRDAHYQFDVLDTRALDTGDAFLRTYHAVFLPSGVALSPQTRLAVQRFHQAGGIVFLSDQAGSTDLWNGPMPSLFAHADKRKASLVWLDRKKLASEQALAEQMSSDLHTMPPWLETLKGYVQPELDASPDIAVSRRRPLMVFNRSAEQAAHVTFPKQKSQDVLPGQEMPSQSPTTPRPFSPQQPSVDLLQSWQPYGVSGPSMQHDSSGMLSVDFPAFQGTGLAETGLSHTTPDLKSSPLLLISLTIRGMADIHLPPGTQILLRLSSKQTGRVYEVPLPYPTNGEQSLTFDLDKDFKISGAERRRQIDQMSLIISGVTWPHFTLSIRSLRFTGTNP